MPRRTELPHYGQVLTTRAIIRTALYEISDHVDRGLLYCIANGPNDTEYLPVLYAVCAKLWFVSKLVYKSKNGIVKLPTKIYQAELFDGRLETEEEIVDHLERMHLDTNRSGYVYKCLQPIKQLLCRMISCKTEQVFIFELVYAVDYVLRRDGDMEAPVFISPTALFPDNYRDFCYSEGIAEDVQRIEMWLN